MKRGKIYLSKKQGTNFCFYLEYTEITIVYSIKNEEYQRIF